MCIYRAPDGCITSFIEQFEILLNSLKYKDKPLIICGDFNINFLDNNSIVSKFRSLIHSYNMAETINTLTRITLNSQTCLDQIIVDSDKFPFKTENVNMGISDHNATFIYVTLGKIKIRNNKINFKRTYSEGNIEYCKFMLQKENWADITSKPEVQRKTTEFNNLITQYFNIGFPIKKTLLKFGNNHKQKSWLTKGIITSCKRKRKLYKMCQTINNANLKLYYNKYTNILRKVITEAKFNSNRDFIMRAENKGKAMWEVVKKETGKITGMENNEIKICQPNGAIITNPLDIAETFNQYFANITKNATTHLPYNTQPNIKLAENKNSMFLTPVTMQEILNIISKLKNSRSSGIDDIPDFLIKKCATLITTPLVDICNSSLTEGKFPDNLKVAKVKPIFKKGEKHSIENYRPISLLSGFSKILEKVMYNRVIPFLESNKTLSTSQFGFRKGKGISHALCAFIDSVLNARDDKKQTIGLFLDLSKAFDMVNHQILIKKLNKYGLRGLAESWFASYLSNRKQIVIIDSTKSSVTNIEHGVPQGSILGPILFLLYINDLPLNTSHAEVILFADDTNMIFESINKNDLQIKISDTSSKLEEWLVHNKLKLNANKTVYMNFNQPKPGLQDPIQIKLNNTLIKEVECTKFLGIWVDSKLTWESHIHHLTQKLSSLCYAFRILSKISPMELLKSIYYGYVHSVISYGIVVWGSTSKSTQIFKFQKRILKIIKQVPIRTESKQVFKELSILPLPCMYILETVSFIHQNINSFKTNCDYHEHNTRAARNIHINYHRLTRSLNSVSHQGFKLYNKLPKEIKILDQRKFKNKVKHVLLSNLPFSVNEYLSLQL